LQQKYDKIKRKKKNLVKEIDSLKELLYEAQRTHIQDMKEIHLLQRANVHAQKTQMSMS